MQHTKGPWRIENSENELEFVILSKNSNANLISAAPEMLQALEHVQNEINKLVKKTPELVKLYTDLIPVIKKATGEQ